MSTSNDTGLHLSNQLDVEFSSGGVVLRGWLRTPPTPGPHPLIILAHGLGGLKEWTIPEVANSLVESGFAALAFDYRNFGDSGGNPREEVDHAGQIEDWRNAITHATMLPEIDSDRIGLWGTSLGGRNVLAVAALDPRAKCVVVQVPPISLDVTMTALAFTGAGVDEFYRVLAEDRRERASGNDPRYITFEHDDPDAEHADYWATFGKAEQRNWNRRLTLRSFEPALGTDIMFLMRDIAPTPLLMILADADTSGRDQLAAFEAAGEPKSLLMLHGHHYSVYTEHKEQAIAAARDWFVEHLGQRAAAE